MKKVRIIIGLIALSLTACVTVQEVGRVNLVSTRNIDPNYKYQLISSYVGGSKKELKRSRATSIEGAIDQTVKKVPGGEYLMNAKIYLIKKGGYNSQVQYFAVEGDVWGNPSQSVFRGFKVGDKVTWKKKDIVKGTKFFTGTITALKDDKTCYVKSDDDNQTLELSYDEITKVQQ